MPEQQPHSHKSAGQLSLLGTQELHQHKPCVAICTLTSDTLRESLQQEDSLKDILVGSLHTENLGIEHIITYVLHNPNIRFIVLCGQDGHQAIGHLPGQSFLALMENGIDANGKIIGAKGKRPIIQNLSQAAIDHFRNTVKMIDLVGNESVGQVLDTVKTCIENSPGVAEPFEAEASQRAVDTVTGSAPDRMISDPNGYFVINADQNRQQLRMEHYTNQGVLNLVIEGHTGPELYFAAIERELISRLDHAAYLGRELDRAEMALRTGLEYVQDAKLH